MADPVKEFFTVETSKSSLVRYIDLSKDLVNESNKIIGNLNPVVIAENCPDIEIVCKVFSHNIRAFLAAWDNSDLKYNRDEPPYDRNLEKKEFTTVSTTVEAFVKYKEMSKNMVDAYVKIMNIQSATITPVNCKDIETVSKVFSHSARAFLAWDDSDLHYVADELADQP